MYGIQHKLTELNHLPNEPLKNVFKLSRTFTDYFGKIASITEADRQKNSGKILQSHARLLSILSQNTFYHKTISSNPTPQLKYQITSNY